MEEIKEALVAMTDNIKSKKSVRNTTTTSVAEINDEQKAGSFLVNTAIQYMRENYNKKLTLCEVADHIYISQWHLSKLLNKHMGVNFSEILNSIRIKEAKKLLQDPALRVGEIGEMVGFVDMAHFSRVFKKLVGTSANEYRNHIHMKSTGN
jgi:YesN/AraC family two-component response regulator